MKKISVFSVAILVLLSSCTTDPEESTKVIQTNTIVYNEASINNITCGFNEDNNEFYLTYLLNPGTYSLGDYLFIDGELHREIGSRSPVFTINDVVAESHSLLALNFIDSASVKIYNYEYDSSDSTIVINQQLLAEAKVFKR